MANTFHLQVVTPIGMMVDEPVESCIVRTTEGDLGILKGHANYMAAVDVGQVRVKRDGNYRTAAASDGFVQITGEAVKVVVTTFEWADEIDVPRAQNAKERATASLDGAQDNEMKNLAKFRLRKARNRLRIAGDQS